MGDQNGSRSLLSIRDIRKSLSSGLGIMSRKERISKGLETYEVTPGFGDPDPGKSHLCYECNKLMYDLHCHPWNDPWRVQIPIGETYHYTTSDQHSYRGLQVVDDCTLCSMVLEIMIARFCHGSDDWSSISHWGYVLKPTRFGEVFDSEPRRHFGQEVSKRRTRHARWYLGIEINDSSGSKAPRLIPNAIQGAIRPLLQTSMTFYTLPEQAIFEQRPFLNGRVRGLECNPELLKNWLYLCDRHHSATSTQCSPRVDRQGPDIRLIDTKNQCIVSKRILDSYTHQGYVALSYVWGDVEQVYLPSDGGAYLGLTKRGSLLDLKLSKTIADAMQLIERLGLRYLWVDALCIKQDDLSDKEQHIARMGFVFQNALFTIIAASGSDCDAGLPGIRPGTRFKRQQLVEAGNITLLSSIQRPYEKIITPETSKWARRAWTFQEELLSRRRLIFTDEQVWWQCPHATWCEQSQLETQDAIGFLVSSQRVEPSLKKRYSKLRPKDYFELVSKYAQRELSYSSDALNAFNGILSVLTDYSNERFFWGFANSSFERQLSWAGKVKARITVPDECFPTWSWVNWEGGISFKNYETYNPVIVCFTIRTDEESQETPHLVCSPATAFGARDYDLPLPDTLSVTTETIDKAYPTDLLKPNFHILFYTYSASFYLMPQGRLILPDQTPRYNYDKRGKVIGTKPDYGHLIPSLDEHEFCEKGYRECILLGQRPASSTWEEAHVVVMLIRRHERGYAQRLGIADMPEEFWKLSNKTWELIALG